MLVKFSMVSGSSFDMFEQKAVSFIHAMELTGTIPSAINPEDIPLALSKLEKNLNSIGSDAESNNENEDDAVSARTRAYPLIELLKKAIKEDKAVMWENA